MLVISKGNHLIHLDMISLSLMHDIQQVSCVVVLMTMLLVHSLIVLPTHCLIQLWGTILHYWWTACSLNLRWKPPSRAENRREMRLIRRPRWSPLPSLCRRGRVGRWWSAESAKRKMKHPTWRSLVLVVAAWRYNRSLRINFGCLYL